MADSLPPPDASSSPQTVENWYKKPLRSTHAFFKEHLFCKLNDSDSSAVGVAKKVGLAAAMPFAYIATGALRGMGSAGSAVVDATEFVASAIIDCCTTQKTQGQAIPVQKQQPQQSPVSGLQSEQKNETRLVKGSVTAVPGNVSKTSQQQPANVVSQPTAVSTGTQNEQVEQLRPAAMQTSSEAPQDNIREKLKGADEILQKEITEAGKAREVDDKMQPAYNVPLIVPGKLSEQFWEDRKPPITEEAAKKEAGAIKSAIDGYMSFYHANIDMGDNEIPKIETQISNLEENLKEAEIASDTVIAPLREEFQKLKNYPKSVATIPKDREDLKLTTYEKEAWLWTNDLWNYFSHLETEYPGQIGRSKEFLGSIAPQENDFAISIENAIRNEFIKSPEGRPPITPEEWKKYRFRPYFLNLGGSHWSLLLVDTKKRTVEHYESFGKDSGYSKGAKGALEKATNVLSELDSSDRPYQFEEKINTGGVQQDGYQCGVWACYFLEQKLQNPDVNFDLLRDAKNAQANAAKAQKTMIENFRQKMKIQITENPIAVSSGRGIFDNAIRQNRPKIITKILKEFNTAVVNAIIPNVNTQQIPKEIGGKKITVTVDSDKRNINIKFEIPIAFIPEDLIGEVKKAFGELNQFLQGAFGNEEKPWQIELLQQ